MRKVDEGRRLQDRQEREENEFAHCAGLPPGTPCSCSFPLHHLDPSCFAAAQWTTTASCRYSSLLFNSLIFLRLTSPPLPPMAGCVLKDALGCSSHPLAPSFTTPPPSPSPRAFLGCGSRTTLSHNSSHPPGPNAIKYLLFLRGRPGQFRFPPSSSPSPRSAFFLPHGVGGFATVSKSCACYGDSASERTEGLFYLQDETSLRSFLEETTINVAQIPQMLLRASGTNLSAASISFSCNSARSHTLVHLPCGTAHIFSILKVN